MRQDIKHRPFLNFHIDGNWGAWSTFGACSATCNGGTQTRARVCNNPAPANGGATCAGSATESAACNTQSCSLGNINYTEDLHGIQSNLCTTATLGTQKVAIVKKWFLFRGWPINIEKLGMTLA